MDKKHILILTMHKPQEFQFEEWLGSNVNECILSLILDKESTCDKEVEKFLKHSVFKFVKSYSNYLNNGNVYLDVEKLHYEHSITDIIAFGEDDIIRAARLRDRLGILGGQSIQNAISFRDKSVMKNVLLKEGIFVHTGKPVEHPLSLIEFVEKHGLPAYIKPRTSSGSVFGRKVTTKEELQEFLEKGFSPRIPYSEYVSDMCIETFQTGDLYHVDGICLDGEIKFLWPSKYLTQGLQLNNFSHIDIVGSYMLSQENPIFNKLVHYVKNVCKALSLPNGYTFHAEVFIDGEAKLSLCEITCRTGGGRVNDTIEAACGINLNKLKFLLQSKILKSSEALKLLNSISPITLCGWMLIPPREGVCKSIPNFSKLIGIKKAKISISVDDIGWQRSFSGDSFGYAILEGKDEKELYLNMEKTIEHVLKHLKFDEKKNVSHSSLCS